MPPETTESVATVTVENVGGITESEVDFSSGVTVLRGRNATNRTSFLQAVMAALGSTNVSLKADAGSGRVELTLDGETYHRTLEQTNESLRFDGEPYLDDASVADLFAFLVESNTARQAVVRGDDLRGPLMEPVDTEAIRAEIDRLEAERDELDAEIEERESLKQELPSLESEKQRLEEEIEAKQEELADLEADIEEADADLDETREEKQALDSRLQELRDLRSELETVRADIDLEEQSIESLRGERAELREEAQSLPDEPAGDHEQLEEIARLRDEKHRLESTVGTLQDVIQFNEEMLNGDESGVAAEIRSSDTSGGGPTDELVADETVVCWTCGTDVSRDRIEETVNELRTVRKEYRADIRDLEAEVEELRASKREREEQRRKREQVSERLRDVEDEIDEREARLADFRDRRDELRSQVETVESAVEELEAENFSRVLDLHKEANEVEFELGRLESDLDDVTDRLARIEDQVAEIPELRDEREAVQAELEDQRTRVDQLEREAVDEFNDRMDEVLDLLGYQNLERVWIERVQPNASDGRRNAPETVFELHVVRTTETGTAYEDTVDHLSESEREVVGLTFALAGYLTHDLHETVPVMVLDSLEAIDSERIADLVAYFSEYVPYLLVALLPEDAQALPDAHERIDEI